MTHPDPESDMAVAASRAQSALDALAEYDETRNTMRLIRDLNRLAGRPDDEEDETK